MSQNRSAFPPRISIGMPVHNGADRLADALDSLLAQTEKNLEIIISDNASTDATPDICRAYAGKDSRIRVIRQRQLIPAIANFIFVRDQARAPYFMWAAHDDTRSPDYAGRLADALDADPKAILAFGDVIHYSDGKAERIVLDFASAGRTTADRLRRTANSQLHHIYGLWRLEVLRSIPWLQSAWWSDSPFMMAASVCGDFIYVPGVEFHYLDNQRWFLSWPRRPGLLGVLEQPGRLLRRIGQLFSLIPCAIRCVGRVAGPWAGFLAGIFAAEKIVRQIRTFFTRRLHAWWAARKAG